MQEDQPEWRTPEADRAALSERLKVAVERISSKREAAKVMGVSDAQLFRYLNGSSTPTVAPLIGLARATGISLHWLCTGEGQSVDGRDDATIASDVKPEVLRAAVGAVVSGVKELGFENVGPKTMAKLVTRLYIKLLTRQVPSEFLDREAVSAMGSLELISDVLTPEQMRE